jgi:choice-of-anchor C domain-containing protein
MFRNTRPVDGRDRGIANLRARSAVRPLLRSLFAGLGICLAMAGTCKAALVPLVNADFELPALANGTAAYTVATQGLTGWTIAAGEVDQVRDGGWQQVSGLQFLDLSGAQGGSLFQDVATNAGEGYVLSFSLAGNVDGGPAVKQVVVSWDGAPVALLSFDTTGRSRADMGWTTEQLSLPAATTGTTRLQFTAGTVGSFGATIDNVTLAALPLPPALWAAPFGIAAAGLCYLRMRRTSGV